MSILTSLISCMSGDSSTNTFANGGIVYEHLPVDFDSSKTWIVFGYASSGNELVLSTNNALCNYNLNVQVVSQSINNVIDTSERLIAYLINYSDDNLNDISLVDDDLNLNLERNVYYKTVNFDVIFTN